jgi:hypothetical protein
MGKWNKETKDRNKETKGQKYSVAGTLRWGREQWQLRDTTKPGKHLTREQVMRLFPGVPIHPDFGTDASKHPQKPIEWDD